MGVLWDCSVLAERGSVQQAQLAMTFRDTPLTVPFKASCGMWGKVGPYPTTRRHGRHCSQQLCIYVYCFLTWHFAPGTTTL